MLYATHKGSNLLECLLAISLSTVVTTIILTAVIHIEPALRYSHQVTDLQHKAYWMSRWLTDWVQHSAPSCAHQLSSPLKQQNQSVRGASQNTAPSLWHTLKPIGPVLFLAQCQPPGSQLDTSTVALDLEDSRRTYPDHQPIVSLYRRLNNGRRLELISQVTQWQLRYWYQPTPTQSGQWVSSPFVKNWLGVKAIEIAWVLRSHDPILKQASTQPLKQTHQHHKDRYLYLPWIIRIPTPQATTHA